MWANHYSDSIVAVKFELRDIRGTDPYRLVSIVVQLPSGGSVPYHELECCQYQQ